MRSMIFLALIIVVVSGLIAYIGDLVGRKMGRKRLSLFGLRPRHTAIIISVGVGMLIAFLTLITIMAVNRSVRDAFFSLDKVKADLKLAKTQLAEANEQSSEMRAKLTGQTAELDMLKPQLEASRGQRDEIERLLQTKRGELTRANTDLHSSKVKLSATLGKLDSAQSRVIDLNRKELPQWRDKNLAWQYIASQLVFSPLSFSYGQEILSGLMPRIQSKADRRSYLEDFFSVAERIVRQRCRNLPKESPALVFLAGDKSELKYITEKAAIDLLIKRIEAMPLNNSIVIQLSSINNVPTDGFAFIAAESIDLTSNELVFNEGDTVAKVSMSIDGNSNNADIIEKIADTLLRQKLPEALHAKNMAQITRRFDPNRSDRIPEISTPTVSWVDLMTAVEKAKKMQGKVSFIARSHTDVTYYGPLTIDIDVAPEP